MVSVGMSVIKYILFVLNLIFVLCGIAIIAVGVLVLTGAVSLQYLSSFTRGTVIFFVVIGSVVFIIAFFGCCGALRESFVKLVVYALALFIIFILELVVIAIVAISTTNVDGDMKKEMELSLTNYHQNATDKDFWDAIQRYFECCGVDGPADWSAKGLALPETCCQKEPQNATRPESGTCIAFGQDFNYLREEGCHDKVVAMVHRCCNMIYIAGICAIIFELLALGVAIWLAVEIKREDTY